jgi:hypothetical protein
VSTLSRRGPGAATPARLPGLQASRIADPATRSAVEALREWVEVRLGSRGDKFERAVTFRDLELLGLSKGAQATTSSQSTSTTQVNSGGDDSAAIADLQRQINNLVSQLSLIGGGITALTGDATAEGSGTVQVTFASTGVTAGAYTYSAITVDVKGRVTAIASGAPPVPLAGGTMTGPLILPAGVAGGSPLNIPHGVGATTPADGDIWTTTLGVYVRVNGNTIGPLVDSTGGGVLPTLGILMAFSSLPMLY